MPIFLKNNSGSDSTWSGLFIENGTYRTLTEQERLRLSEDDSVISDIGTSNLIVATGSDGLGDVGAAKGTALMLGTFSHKIADPFPLNEGHYSFRGTGLSGTLNGSGTNGGITHVDTLISELRYIDAAEIHLSDSSLFGVDVDFLVVDKDGAGIALGWYDEATFLAMGSYYQVEQFGYGWRLDPRLTTVARPGYPAVIPAGLYVRCSFTNPNTSGCSIYGNLFLHKKAT